MRVIKLELHNYKGIKYLKIEKPLDLVVLIGPNGSGKSTILNALYEALSFCFGHISECSKGIYLSLDFSQHIKSLQKILNNQRNNLIGFLKNYVSLPENIIEETYVHIKNEIIRILKSKKIIIFEDNNLKLLSKINNKNEFYTEYKKNIRSELVDEVFIINRFIHEVLKTRSQGNSEIPGVAILENEKNLERHSTFDLSQASNIRTERIRRLFDQSWRLGNLGTRLISLNLEYIKKSSVNKDYSLPNPIVRINNSLALLLPHIRLLAPIESDTKLKFIVREKELTLDQLSSGEIAIVNYAVDYLEIELNGGVLIIDEPGAYLHYNLQKLILEFILELSTFSNNGQIVKPQIWISTHSPSIIDSVKMESKYFIDINNSNAAIHWKNEKDMIAKQLLNIIGYNQYFKTPILFLEGETDTVYLKLILRKFYPEIYKKWNFEFLNGVSNIEKTIELQKEFSEKTKNIQILQEQLKQNHFLKDNDNKDQQIKTDNTYILDVYHIENLLFQEPWLGKLKEIIKHRAKSEIDINKALDKAIEEIFKEFNKIKDAKLESIKRDEKWKRVLPGRDLFKRWKKYSKISFSIKDAFKHLVNSTETKEDLPEEIKNLTMWLNDKYLKWMES